MYAPHEISSLEMLSGYLRTDILHLKKLINGNKLIHGTMLKMIGNLNDLKDYDLSIVRYSIPKRNPNLGYRHVFEIEDQFAIDTFKVLKFNLDDLYIPHPSVHGFVKGKNIATNATAHLGKKNLLTLDITKFFESITIDRVALAFTELGFEERISQALSEITTLSGNLVQGFHTSPVIANLVSNQMDIEIDNHCKANNSIYTRYADDISISSDGDLPSYSSIIEIISKHGFVVNESKSKFFRRGQKQYVTGLSIFDNKYPRIPKRIKKRIRQELYYICKFGLREHETNRKKDGVLKGSGNSSTMNRIKGWIDFIYSIEPEVAKVMYKDYNEAVILEHKRWEDFIKSSGGIIEFPGSNKL